MNYQRIYNSIIQHAIARKIPNGYYETHHIIPRCIGGDDCASNLVKLTPEEHFLCHVLLVKIHPTHPRLIYAVNHMCSGHHGKRKSRKLYGWLRRRFAEQRSIDTKGTNNPQYSTMWINKWGTTINRKIPKGDTIPDGWIKGRIIKRNLCSTCSVQIRDRRRKFCDDCVDESMTANRRSTQAEKNVDTLCKYKEALLVAELNIDNAMSSLGYKVPQYGCTRNKFKQALSELQAMFHHGPSKPAT